VLILAKDKRQGWFDPVSGAPCEFSEIVLKLKSKSSYTVHVGTDSHRAKPKDCAEIGKGGYVFATVICLCDPGRGATYYCRRSFRPGEYDGLRHRIMDEVSESVDVSLALMEHVPTGRGPISVHADVNSDARYKTNVYLQQVRSWIQSIGFKFLCKPHAWASSGVADKHAK
jgi:predicted RNase H-related nuclease YkuK (DUF458 family)